MYFRFSLFLLTERTLNRLNWIWFHLHSVNSEIQKQILTRAQRFNSRGVRVSLNVPPQSLQCASAVPPYSVLLSSVAFLVTQVATWNKRLFSPPCFSYGYGLVMNAQEDSEAVKSLMVSSCFSISVRRVCICVFNSHSISNSVDLNKQSLNMSQIWFRKNNAYCWIWVRQLHRQKHAH